MSWTWVALVIELDNAVESRGSEHVGQRFRISYPMWANGLRLIDEKGITVDELQARAHARCNLAGLERWGWIAVGDRGAKRRVGYGTQRGIRADTVVRPTRAGVDARLLWPGAVAEVETRWEARFGAESIASLRRALDSGRGNLPWSLPEVHPSDRFVTHVIEGEEAETDHPLVAALGRALSAMTVGHEANAAASLPIAANALRLLADRALSARQLATVSGISREAAAMATGVLVRSGLGVLGPRRALALSGRGSDAFVEYRALAPRIEAGELRAVLEAIVHGGRLAEGLVPPPGCWRGAPPYLAQTRRILADPLAALPSQPMVLHRGGWPDGA